jgi:hypothetical protein
LPKIESDFVFFSVEIIFSSGALTLKVGANQLLKIATMAENESFQG